MIALMGVFISTETGFAQGSKSHAPRNLAKPTNSKTNPDNQRVTFGTPVKPGNFPFQVLLQTRKSNGDGSWCGGSLIGDATWVLTAAHCVVDSTGSIMAPYQISVLVGSVNYGEGNIILAKQVYTYPTYKPAVTDYDVALIQLRTQPRAVRYGVIDLIDPILESTLGKSDVPVTVIGWGNTEKGEPSARLLEGHTHIADHARCNKHYVDYFVEAFKDYLASIGNSPRKPEYEEDLFAWLAMDELTKSQIRGLIQKQAPVQQILDVATAKAGIVITDRMICAGESVPKPGYSLVTDACHGDSGGPLFTNNADGKLIQVGVVSWGVGGGALGCGSPDTPGVYARVAKFTTWVNTIMTGTK